jgi:hypothetical protein
VEASNVIYARLPRNKRSYAGHILPQQWTLSRWQRGFLRLKRRYFRSARFQSAADAIKLVGAYVQLVSGEELLFRQTVLAFRDFQAVARFLQKRFGGSVGDQ